MMLKELIAVVCLGVVVKAQLNADLPQYACPTLAYDVHHCQNGADALPFTDFPDGVDVGIRNPDTYFTQDSLEKACNSSIRRKFREVGKCVIKAYRHCGDNNFKQLVITPEQFAEVFELACENLAVSKRLIQCVGSSYFDCVRNRLARQYQYNSRPGISQQFGEFVDYYCGIDRIEDFCFLSDSDTQKCISTASGSNELYKSLKRIIRREACGL